MNPGMDSKVEDYSTDYDFDKPIRFAYEGHPMNVTLLKALIALLPAGMLFCGSAVLFSRGKSGCSFLQLMGTACLMLVVLTHVSEALHLFSWMHWGAEHSIGHYLDFWSAVSGLTLFPVGYLLQALAKTNAQQWRG